MLLKTVTIILACSVLVLGSPSRLPGKSELSRSGNRIVGGTVVKKHEIPWQVSIKFYEGLHYCGGSIISKNYIITAAHVTEYNGYPPSYFQVVAGTEEWATPGTIHNVTEIIVHELFEPYTYENDIAIWKVDPPFKFAGGTQPVTLPAQGAESVPEIVMTVSGWGSTAVGGGGQASDVLLKGDLFVVSKEECNRNYEWSGGIAPNQMCAGVPMGGIDACEGDDGGPLFFNGELRGLVSWGRGCGTIYYPGVYTEVSAYRNWINQTVGV
ncbi:trypsin-2-like [Cloeon dipterum]|uniref:trypsin-2-like n=1 Tax=Cloeon dipterum TaxID=197152 RepID=UPI00321FEA92